MTEAASRHPADEVVDRWNDPVAVIAHGYDLVTRLRDQVVTLEAERRAAELRWSDPAALQRRLKELAARQPTP